jgi:phosphoglucomutase
MDIEKIKHAFESGKICRESYENLVKWLTGIEYQPYWGEIEDYVKFEKWTDLDDAFFKIIEFGTGGRRGPRGVGPNRINLRTIGESAQGLCDYIHEAGKPEKGVVVAYDTRYYSREFAKEVCQIIAGNAIPAYIYPEPRSTPQLSFSIRHLKTQAGCMISASHNPPSDNGIKVSWSDGGQVLPPHDKGIIDKVTQVNHIRKTSFESLLQEGKIIYLDDSIDRAYLDCLETFSLSKNRGAKIAYSPLHGVGSTNVVPLLVRSGFDLVTVSEQMKPDPEFSTVKNKLPNPELPAAMEQVTQLAAQERAAVALASDPDADRLGATIPCPSNIVPSGWFFLTGNQIGVLILEHVLRRLLALDRLPEGATVIKTIVTTEMLDAICADYGVKVIKNLLVGFKYIAEIIENLPPNQHVIVTTEESHGFNRGTFVRDKDSAPAALHMAELACDLQSQGKTIFRHLNDLYRKYGYFCEITRSVFYEGKSGLDTMMRIMENLRNHPPLTIGQYTVDHLIDRSTNQIKNPKTGLIIGNIEQHKGNVMVFNFDKSGLNRVTARPSGTEPKIKFYAQLWAAVPAGTADEQLEEIKKLTAQKAIDLIDAVSKHGS